MADRSALISPPILTDSQFSQADALAVVGISWGALKGLLDRKQITLTSEHNPGSGRRRMFTGGDIIQIATAHAVSSIGFPLKLVHWLTREVDLRARMLVGDFPIPRGKLAFAFYATGDDDVAIVRIVDDVAESPIPVAMMVLAADRLIEETVAKLKAIVDDEPMPSFDIPEIKSENPYSPETNFFRAWDKDTEGRTVRTGLTFEETQELHAIQDRTKRKDQNRDQARYLELRQKHELARLTRLSREHPLKESGNPMRPETPSR